MKCWTVTVLWQSRFSRYGSRHLSLSGTLSSLTWRTCRTAVCEESHGFSVVSLWIFGSFQDLSQVGDNQHFFAAAFPKIVEDLDVAGYDLGTDGNKLRSGEIIDKVAVHGTLTAVLQHLKYFLVLSSSWSPAYLFFIIEDSNSHHYGWIGEGKEGRFRESCFFVKINWGFLSPWTDKGCRGSNFRHLEREIQAT